MEQGRSGTTKSEGAAGTTRRTGVGGRRKFAGGATRRKGAGDTAGHSKLRKELLRETLTRRSRLLREDIYFARLAELVATATVLRVFAVQLHRENTTFNLCDGVRHGTQQRGMESSGHAARPAGLSRAH